jgi:hypothetical protein
MEEAQTTLDEVLAEPDKGFDGVQYVLDKNESKMLVWTLYWYIKW